jgi:hypothetical protein
MRLHLTGEGICNFGAAVALRQRCRTLSC